MYPSFEKQTQNSARKRKLPTFRILMGLGLMAALPGFVTADEVVFKSGITREGRVENVFGKPEKILLITATGRLELNRSLISRVDETDDPTDYVILGDQYLKGGTYSEAIRSYERALQYVEQYNMEGKSPAPGIEADAREGIDNANSGISTRRQQDAQQQQMQNASIIERAREMIVQEEFSKVENLLKSLKDGDLTDQQKSAIKVLERDLYLAWGLEREDKLDRGGAEVYFSRVMELDPTNRQAEEALLRIWERDTGKTPQLIEIYEGKLLNAPNDVELNRKLADLYLRENDSEKAIGPLTRIIDTPVFRANNYDTRLKKAYTDAAFKEATQGNYDGAIALMKDMIDYFPASDPSQLYLFEYQKLARQIGTDSDERSKLLADLWDKGLHKTALDEAYVILRDDPTNENAIGLIKGNAEEELADIEKTFREGQYLLAANTAASFGNRYSNQFPSLVQQAADIYNKAELEAARIQKEKREQARDIVAQGDQYAAEARRNVELFKSADNFNRSAIVSYKSEARRYINRAINAYQTALQIDPSLGPLQGGLDVNAKIEDAERLSRSLNADAPNQRIRRPTGFISP